MLCLCLSRKRDGQEELGCIDKVGMGEPVGDRAPPSSTTRLVPREEEDEVVVVMWPIAPQSALLCQSHAPPRRLATAKLREKVLSSNFKSV